MRFEIGIYPHEVMIFPTDELMIFPTEERCQELTICRARALSSRVLVSLNFFGGPYLESGYANISCASIRRSRTLTPFGQRTEQVGH
jgi:hypothetical protein